MRTQTLSILFEDGAEKHALFKEVMAEALYAEVDPPACVPFTNNHKTTKSGVLRFVPIFSGLGAAKLCLLLLKFRVDQTVPLSFQ